MKCRYTSANSRLEFEVDADSQKALFARIANLQEVFEADSACGCCGSDDIRFRVRQAENKAGVKCDYYELHCGACDARLSYGQHQTGDTLWVKRRDANGNAMPNHGWYVYVASEEREEEAPQAAPRPAVPSGKFPTPAAPTQANGTAGPKTPIPTAAPKTPIPTKATASSTFAAPPMNGSTSELLSFEQAKAACTAAGISVDDMVQGLRKRGQTKWNNIVCTPLVREIIAEAALTPEDANIPF